MSFFSLTPYVISRREINGGLLFNPKNATTIEVDRQAFRLLELLDGSKKIRDIYFQIKSEFDGNFSFRDCNRLIKQLTYHGFLTQKPFSRSKSDILPVDPWFEGKKLSAPDKIHLMITNRCNFSCEGCYSHDITGSNLKKNQLKNLIDHLSLMKVFQIAIGGGEPLIHEDILEIIHYAHKKGILPNITTNGSYLTNEMASILQHYLGKIQFSLVSSERKINDKFRHPGAWKDFLNGGKLARTNKLKIGVNILVTRTTLPLLPETIRFVLDQGISEVNFLQPKPVINLDKWFSTNKLHNKDLRGLKFSLINLKNKYPELRFFVDCSLTHLMDNLPKKSLLEKGVFGCTAGRRFVTILSNGKVYPCSFLLRNSFYLGNIREKSIKNIWNQIPDIKNYTQELLFHCPAIT